MGSLRQGYDNLKQTAGEKLVSTYEEYHGLHSLLTFTCTECGTLFHTTKFLYEKSADSKRCMSCKKKLAVYSTDARTEYINRCVEQHGGYYDYSLVPEEFSAKTKITVICPKHGAFDIGPHEHKKGQGCAKCKIDKITGATRSNKTDFIVKANGVHAFKYNYTNVEYVNAKTPIAITCPSHGPFNQTPDVHLRGSGCPRCVSSLPMREILNSLEKQGLSYITEKTFPALKSNKLLRFDVYVPSLNLCIEYDGPHHTQPVTYGTMTHEDAVVQFEKQQRHDELKNQFCEENNIELIRIPYTDYNPGAVVSSYIAERSPERYMYTYSDLTSDVKGIVNYIKSFNYDRFAVYGIKRGGIIFSTHVSYILEDQCEYGIVSFQRYDGNDKVVDLVITHTDPTIPIFVIDDLISSGITMNKVVKKLKSKFKKADVHPIVVFGEENDDDVFFLHPHPKKWVVFPYEI